MSGNIKYSLKQKNLHILTVTHKDFNKMHQEMLYMAIHNKNVNKKMRGICFLLNVSNFKSEIKNNKVISISYDIEQKTEFEDIKKKDKLFWEMTPFFRILKV